MRSLKLVFTFLVGCFVCVGLLIAAAQASLFGEENGVLSQILMEDVKHTIHLQDVVSFAGKELKSLNDQYGYNKWINKGLDKIKDYGVLKDIKTDDFILGTFQSDMGKVGNIFEVNSPLADVFGQKEYNFNNIDEWVNQIYGTQSEWLGSSVDLSSAVGRQDANLAYKHYLYNVDFDKKIKERYPAMWNDATQANPGEAARLSAQTGVLQNVQLANINDTQSNILKLMAKKEWENTHEVKMKQFNMMSGFKGVLRLSNSVPTLGH